MNEPLTAISLFNFRSYGEASFEFSPGVNIIIGPNAAGKTNLLEAVYIACVGKGFRSRRDIETIKLGCNWLRIESGFGKNSRTIFFDSSSGRLKKSYLLTDKKNSRLKYDDIRPVVLFQPDDLRLASGSPERRRNFIDSLLTQTKPGYGLAVRDYERALNQRNSLLKSHNFSEDHLFVWNLQLAEKGGLIAATRTELIVQLNKYISSTYSEVAGSKHDIEIKYQSDVETSNYSDSLLKILRLNINQDIARGTTSYGPHRDDVIFEIDNSLMKNVASRGENRTLLLALKILELKEIEKQRHIRPLLLLDDVFSELDGSRRKLLTNYLKNHQTLITTTDADVIGKSFIEVANVLSISR